MQNKEQHQLSGFSNSFILNGIFSIDVGWMSLSVYFTAHFTSNYLTVWTVEGAVFGVGRIWAVIVGGPVYTKSGLVLVLLFMHNY